MSRVTALLPLLLACAAPRAAEPPPAPTAHAPPVPSSTDRPKSVQAPAAAPAAPGPAAAEPAGRRPRRARRGTEAEIAFCVAETNRHRKAVKKPPFSRSPRLDSFAAEGAEVDARARSPHHHFNTTHYPEPFSAFAENEIPWWHLDDDGGAVERVIRAGLASMMAEGPGGGHYENLVGNYTEMGCGIWIEDDRITIVQNFRKP
jgi:uncharacterized protein YkwD